MPVLCDRKVKFLFKISFNLSVKIEFPASFFVVSISDPVQRAKYNELPIVCRKEKSPCVSVFELLIWSCSSMVILFEFEKSDTIISLSKRVNPFKFNEIEHVYLDLIFN